MVVGNWKMHGSLALGETLAKSISTFANRPHIVLCPPATLIQTLSAAFPAVSWGAQDCHAHRQGAFTGEISASMLKDAGANYVIVGHSERRAGHHENDAAVKAKAEAAVEVGLIPIICVGEPADIRARGDALQYVSSQLSSSLPETAPDLVIAYEPVWAIGTGKTAMLEDIEAMHTHIKQVVAHKGQNQGEKIRVLYGGSVKPENAREILLCPVVDGVLVGGASLDAVQFCSIIEAARK